MLIGIIDIKTGLDFQTIKTLTPPTVDNALERDPTKLCLGEICCPGMSSSEPKAIPCLLMAF